MDFTNRIKKEMTEGMVRAILEDAGYRVIDFGIEKVVREVSYMGADAYNALEFPDAMRNMPDFAVMDKDQKEKFLVEVKYRSEWGKKIFEDVKDQVQDYGEIILVSLNAKAKDPKKINGPSRYLRCCSLKFDGDAYMVEVRNKKNDFEWKDVESLDDKDRLWWLMSPLQEKFGQLPTQTDGKTLCAAIDALTGIVTQ